MIIVGFVIACLGIAFMIYSGVHKKQNKRRTGRVEATCTGVTDKSLGDDDETRHYDFSYIVDGNEYKLTNAVGIPGDPKPGDQVTLCYNPAKPQDAGYYFGDEGKERYILFFGIGVLVLGIILMII